MSDVWEAIILAAGFGTRLKGHISLPKPVIRVFGLPLIAYSMASLRASGVEKFYVVVNEHNANHVEEVVSKADVDVELVVNTRPELGNGYSLLVGMEHVKGERFYVSMSDHIYTPDIPQSLGNPCDADVAVCVDSNPRLVDEEEATRVLVDRGLVLDIGKGLENYTHVDAGVMAMSVGMYDAYTRYVSEDCVNELSSLIRNAVLDGFRVVAVDVSGAPWVDMDRIDDIRRVELEASWFIRELHERLKPYIQPFIEEERGFH